MIAFVVAMEKEGKLFLSSTEILSQTQIAGKHIYTGRLHNGEDYVLIISGIGKVNASMSTQLIIDNFRPSIIVNFGVAGGKSESHLHAGDIVLISEVCQYDFDLSEIDNVNIGYMQDYNLTYYPTNYLKYKGNAFQIRKGASADRFTCKQQYLDIIKNLGADVVDMESGAIAQTAYANQTPLFIVKLISDVDNQEDSIFNQYINNVTDICNKIPLMIDELINNI
jgi:adenosylhomocysteine nucleosidase